MAQVLRLTGAVVVCTPQKVAQDDASRAIDKTLASAHAYSAEASVSRLYAKINSPVMTNV